MRGLGTGELKHPRFTKDEAAASEGTRHERLWSYILSLESSDVHAGGTEALDRGAGGTHSQDGDGLGRLRRLATRYGSDPQEIAAGADDFDRTDSSDMDSADFVPSARKIAYNSQFMVYDFKPGRNTFIDAETGEVRFIDPRVDINDPGAGFSVSRFGKRKIDNRPMSFEDSPSGDMGGLRFSRGGYRPGDWRKTFTFGKAARSETERTPGGEATGEERRRWEENPTDERIPAWDAPGRNPNIAKPFALSTAEGYRLLKALLGGKWQPGGDFSERGKSLHRSRRTVVEYSRKEKR